MNGLGMGLGLGLFLFFIFMVIYSSIKEKRDGVQIEMIRARLMLMSNDSKNIEEFLVLKEPYLTKEMIDNLINRVAEIKAQEIIDKDWANKTRIADLPQPEEIEEEEVYTKRADEK